MTKLSCTHSMLLDEMHDVDEQQMNRDGDGRKVDDGKPDMGLRKSKVNDWPMNLVLNELEEHKNSMADGTEDRRQMHQVMKMLSDCSS